MCQFRMSSHGQLSQSGGTVGGRSRRRSSPNASGEHNTGQVRDTKPADFVLLTLPLTAGPPVLGCLPLKLAAFAVTSHSFNCAIDKALASSVRTFWIACPLSHLMTPQALVPSIGRNVSSATNRWGMSLPEHFRKLVNLCRLRKKQGLWRLSAMRQPYHVRRRGTRAANTP